MHVLVVNVCIRVCTCASCLDHTEMIQRWTFLSTVLPGNDCPYCGVCVRVSVCLFMCVCVFVWCVYVCVCVCVCNWLGSLIQ